MMFHCDYVVATKASMFATPFVGLGLVPEGASSLLMPRALGHQKAFEILVMGRRIDGEAAQQAGFVNQVAAPGQAEAEALKVAQEIAALPPEAVAISKRLMRLPADQVAAASRSKASISASRCARPKRSTRSRDFWSGKGLRPLFVVAGLDPAIHVFLGGRQAWMPATSAGMTAEIVRKQNFGRTITHAPSLLDRAARSACPDRCRMVRRPLGFTLSRAPVELTILALNDFHGNLQPPPGGIRVADPSDKTKKVAIPAGGAEHLATLVKQRRKDKKHVFVAAGDLIGASPFLSALFHDEPTIESLSIMGLDVTSVGNHEFDEGATELLRMQKGGCHPDDGCKGPHPFLGAKFKYLAASTFEKATGKTLFPAYEVREFDGIPVAFIGLTLKATPLIVNPAGVAGLEFRDEAETINALIPELKARGIEAIVVLIHEGGFPTGDYNECPGISGPIVNIVTKFDKAVDIVVSGHTHRPMCATSTAAWSPVPTSTARS